jgi:hypothetical protein
MMEMHDVFRPAFGRVLAVVVGAMCGVAVVVTAAQGSVRDVVTALPWLALVAGACWAIFWRPRVEVSDGGVRIVNVMRTIDVPWPAIRDVETKWALKLVTAYGAFTAWAAPSGGRGPARRASRIELRLMTRAPSVGNLAREPESLDGAAGDAAEIVRARWTRLRGAGHLDNPVLEHAKVPVRWHLENVAIGVLLVILGILSVTL